MIARPLVSVITIFYNAEPFLREAIDSVFTQSYDEWELLLVDDGSTDGSTTIAKELARQYPEKVFYLEHPGHRNRGMSASRNLGVNHAKGDYIAFLDADDVWLQNKLEQQVAVLDSQKEAAMVYGPTQWWYSWMGSQANGRYDYIHELGVPADTLLQPPELLTQFLRREGISPCTCSVLIRRSVVEQVGGFEEIFRGLYEDQAFFAKVCLSAPIFVSSECTARYRQHSNSNCYITQATGDNTTARPAFLSWLSDYLTKSDIRDQVVWKALREEMWPYQHRFLHGIQNFLVQTLYGKPAIWISKLRSRWLRLPIIRQLRSLQFRRLTPLSDGRQLGTPVVRYYWEDYLQKHKTDVRGHALEIGTAYTIRRIGGKAILQADALDLTAHSPEITVTADISRADHLPSDTYDCFVNQFTMHLIYDVEAAIYHAIRILKPGGVLLVNFPCVDYYFSNGLDMGTGKPLFVYWWFTPLQVENLLRKAGLQGTDYTLEVYGNLFARVAYQFNIPAEELTRKELEYQDPGHPLLICARVVKPADWQGKPPLYRDAWQPEGVPAKWNPETGHYGG